MLNRLLYSITRYVMIAVFASILASCAYTPAISSTTPTAMLEESTSEEVTNVTTVEPSNSSYPVEDTSLVESYPEPAITNDLSTKSAELMQNFIIPTPSPGLAIVSGIIIDREIQSGPAESQVYLGKLLSTDQGLPVVSVNHDTAPVARIIPDGRFVIIDVEPGEYGVILHNPDINFLLDDPNNPELSLLITLMPDQHLDLGEIQITMP
ncbi:MAG: hypothetical protein IAF02_03945 [Anaerolineae bacterium]|nr:hypothetical protein [Anaerolineae bacterium]